MPPSTGLDHKVAPTTPARRGRRAGLGLLALALPFTVGARGDGCAANSRSPAPDVTGEWAITYDDVIDVEVAIGGAVYQEQLSAAGGIIEIEHDGRPLSFELDCGRPEIVCPSEAWPEQVSVEQREDDLEHRMIVTLPTQRCDGTLRAPDDDECGAGTLNPDCESVCDGDIEIDQSERFGVIGEAGESFRLYLGAGIATNGINCALLGYSLADADLDTTGSAKGGDWEAIGMEDGLVTVGYAGACVWAGDVDMDADLEALLAGASITFRTGFTGERL
jgi:hypothetical protein